MINLVGQNIVLVAQNLNPTIFSQLWLVRNKVFQEDDFNGQNFIFTPAAVNIDTADLNFLVMPERLQVAMKSDDMSKATTKLETTVSSLPHTPYRAVGFNFDWASEPRDAAKYGKDVRNMFLADGNPLRSFFSPEDARFGSYMSVNKFDMRLKLDIKPSIVIKNDKPIEVLLMNFNYHKDIDQADPAKDIIKSLRNLQMAREFTVQLAKEIESGWTQ